MPLQSRFELIGPFLRLPTLIDATTDLINFICRTERIHGPVPLPVNINPRVFLAAYMIELFPREVFDDSPNPLVDPLKVSANSILTKFEAIMHTIASLQGKLQWSRHIADGFSPLLNDYLLKFRAWKVPDEALHCEKIINALYTLRFSQKQLEIPPLNPLDEATRIEFRIQIQRLTQKLAQIGGPTATNAHESLLNLYAQREAEALTQARLTARIAHTNAIANSNANSIAIAEEEYHDFDGQYPDYFTSITLPRAQSAQGFFVAFECRIDPSYRCPSHSPTLCIELQVQKIQAYKNAAESFLNHLPNTPFKVLFKRLKEPFANCLNPESIMNIPREFLSEDLFKEALNSQNIRSGFFFNLIKDLIQAIRSSVFPHRLHIVDEMLHQIDIGFTHPGEDLQRATCFTKAMSDLFHDVIITLCADVHNQR